MKRKSWHRVKAPMPWRPDVGDELVGAYIATKDRAGEFGTYKVHFVQTDDGRVFYASGTQLNDLFSIVEKGMRVKLVYTGSKVARNTGNEYKTFEMYAEKELELKIADVG